MSNQSIELNDTLYQYLLTHSLREHAVLTELRRATAELEMANMQIAPEQGQFMALLLKLIKARQYLEVGTFTGYSALAAAQAMGPDSTVYALDISKEWTNIAKEYWRKAGCAGQIVLKLGDANVTLSGLLGNLAGSIDAMFIDADKTGYLGYIEYAHVLLRPGGLLMLDNTLWGGSVADNSDDEADTVAIRAVNSAMLHDERFEISLVPIGDGLTLAQKL